MRRPGTKILTGLAHEYAGFALTAGAAVPRDKTLADVRTYDEQARELGITTLQMMSVDAWARDPAPSLAEAGTRVRWRLMDFTRAPPADWAPNASPPVRRDDARVYASGTKWILDGTPVERLMWVDDPYVDRPAARGQMNFPSESLRPALTRALSAGEPLLLHAVGDATIDAVFDAMACKNDDCFKSR